MSTEPTTEAKIIHAAYRSLERYGHEPKALMQIMCVLGSFRDTLSDEDVLAYLAYLAYLEDMANCGFCIREM